MFPTPRTATFLRRTRLAFAALLTIGAIAAVPAPADAQAKHRARLSRDLEQRLGSGDTAVTSVILTGSQQRIDRIAARNGLRVHKRLQTGAVVDVPAGALAALAADAEV